MDDVIRSWDELRAAAPAVLRRLGEEPTATVAALANPVLVLERLGWVVEGEDRPQIVDRLRLGPAPAERLAALRARLRKALDRDVDPQDPHDVRRVLDELGVGDPQPDPTSDPRSDPRSGAQLDRRRGTATDRGVPPRTWAPGGALPDPLHPLAGSHPVVDLLLEYRALDAARPPFAPPEVVDAVLRGRLAPAVTGAVARFQKGAGRRSRTTRTAPDPGSAPTARTRPTTRRRTPPGGPTH